MILAVRGAVFASGQGFRARVAHQFSTRCLKRRVEWPQHGQRYLRWSVVHEHNHTRKNNCVVRERGVFAAHRQPAAQDQPVSLQGKTAHVNVRAKCGVALHRPAARERTKSPVLPTSVHCTHRRRRPIGKVAKTKPRGFVCIRTKPDVI